MGIVDRVVKSGYVGTVVHDVYVYVYNIIYPVRTVFRSCFASDTYRWTILL